MSAQMANRAPFKLYIRRNVQLEEGVGDLQHEDVGMVVLVAD